MASVTFRTPRGADDASALIAIHDVCAARDGADTRSLLDYRPTVAWYTHELTRTDPADWVVAERDGAVVGYGHCLWSWPERDGRQVFLHMGWVVPERRGEGIGSELLTRLEARCRDKAATEGRVDGFELAANASGTEDDARRLLIDNDYFVGYTVREMVLTTATLPDIPPLPAPYELRPVEPDHHRAIWQCIGDAYDAVDGSGRFREIADESSFKGYFGTERADPTLWFVAWDRSRIAGQALCRINDGVGEVYEVSVGIAHRRKGLARALLIRALHALRERGVSEIRLFTVHENPTQAWRLYESVGFTDIKTFPRWRRRADEAG